MYTLTFTLKQHTPLIHFQHEQAGATLRATEVKPKLDRFIYQKWLNEEGNKPENVFKKYGHLTVGFSESKMQTEIMNYNKFNSDKQGEYLNAFKWAFDYKLRIVLTGDITKYAFAANLKDYEIPKLAKLGIIGIDKSPFFADEEHFKNEAYDKLRLGIFTEGDIYLYINTLNKELATKIEKNVELFFVLRNFGTRQSKGFGSFTLKETNVLRCENLLKIYVNTLKKEVENSHFFTIFKQITDTHRQLKSGLPATIEESKLLDYLRKKNNDEEVEGDKKAIHDFFYQGNFVKNENSVFARALLGLAGSYGYTKLRIRNVSIKDSEEEVERFKTPYTFKVVGKTIFLIVHTIPDIMFDKEFIFSSNIEDDEKLTLKTPHKNNIELIEFIKQHSGFTSLK